VNLWRKLWCLVYMPFSLWGNLLCICYSYICISLDSSPQSILWRDLQVEVFLLSFVSSLIGSYKVFCRLYFLCSPLNLHCAAIIDLFAGIQSKGAPFHCFKTLFFQFALLFKRVLRLSFYHCLVIKTLVLRPQSLVHQYRLLFLLF